MNKRQTAHLTSIQVCGYLRLLFIRFFQNDKGYQRFFVQEIFQLRVNIYRLSIHLGNRPAVFQQFVEPDKVLIVIDVVLFSKISTVANVDYLLHRYTPLSYFLLSYHMYPENATVSRLSPRLSVPEYGR